MRDTRVGYQCAGDLTHCDCELVPANGRYLKLHEAVKRKQGSTALSCFLIGLAHSCEMLFKNSKHALDSRRVDLHSELGSVKTSAPMERSHN